MKLKDQMDKKAVGVDASYCSQLSLKRGTMTGA